MGAKQRLKRRDGFYKTLKIRRTASGSGGPSQQTAVVFTSVGRRGAAHTCTKRTISVCVNFDPGLISRLRVQGGDGVERGAGPYLEGGALGPAGYWVLTERLPHGPRPTGRVPHRRGAAATTAASRL